MSPGSMIRTAANLALKLVGYIDFVPALLTRLMVGYAFYDSGGGKIKNFDNTVNFFTDLGIPFPELNAAFVSRLEYYGGILLLFGILTRIVAALLSSTMVVALLTADRANFVGAFLRTSEMGLSDIAAFVLLVSLSWLVVKGPGLLSVDTLLKRFVLGGAEPAGTA